MDVKIRQLPPLVANQIAAGEVIERPASVVKELLENAFDAKATAISIDVHYGGLNQIRISDNGCGIAADELTLAIAPYATSKISQLNDLYTICSMGFRGEALASIAAISRLTLLSKPEQQQMAMMLSNDQSLTLTPCARNQGTTVEVKDIFYNAPVRKKFLKTERIEFQAIEMVVKRFALSAPKIAIQLSHNGKAQLNLPAANCATTQLQRIKKLFGKSFVDHAIYLDVEHADMRLRGWVSNHDYQRSQSDIQWIYVNQRMVKDKLLSHAIKQAYEPILHPGRYPTCLLYFTIDPAQVDVNVHPTKHELRFVQPRLVHDFIGSCLQQALAIPGSIGEECSPYRHTAVKQPLGLTKDYQPPQLEVNIDPIPLNHSNWIPLNTDFALTFIGDQPYLLDGIRLYQEWLLTSLKQAPLPLSSRPLLVPITQTLSFKQAIELERKLQLLSEVGFKIDLAGETSLLVRSLPLLTPQLDIKRYLAAVLSLSSPSLEQLISQLVICQPVVLHSLTDIEIKALIALWQAQPERLSTAGKLLSANVCRALING